MTSIRILVPAVLLSLHGVALAQPAEPTPDPEEPTDKPAEPAAKPEPAPVAVPVPPPPPPVEAQAEGEVRGASGFMDVRLNATLTNENVFVKPGETIPSVPGWRFGVPNSLGILFFDNYDT
ncbi:MAG TPA: hypothetical protein VL172_22375, partial [Kofleriaceae bacterium]|nr:hypothetical protein [Kofleriaceae bacterium]